jgi:steroid Delta-isomerase
MPSPEQIADTVNRYISLLAKGSADDLAELYADDATVVDPVGGEVHIGRQAIHGFYSGLTNTDNVERECELVTLRGGRSRGGFPVPVDRERRRRRDRDRAHRRDGVR